ncbi:glycosyltransferase family 4 protein [Winogradskyella aurantiaca]|uniref:glycosyltransferase family 4 protein n=1 Tax=Winogradskyella aurantiaca TaxID=2219558 RepID=UPI000E1DE70A|nr:glycosyltransferase [Winogradskyella aurantiaca]
MKLAIFTIVQHTKKNQQLFGYGPYIREMNLWGYYVEEMLVCGPLNKKSDPGTIDVAYEHSRLTFFKVPAFNLLSVMQVIRSILVIPIIFIQCIRVMAMADHIHLRCPGNIGLIACVCQILFPRKPKSTKYAGNWDPNSQQPWSYKLQQAILRNRFLTRNMKVLVYGEWPNEPEHIIPFISATYYDKDKVPFKKRDFDQILEFVFAASLVPGKRPLLTIQIIEELNKKGYPAILHMFGDGPLRIELEAYITENRIRDQINLYGNRDIQELKNYYQKAHFNILPSKSEGWPKAVAEGMFFGCIPVTTSVSCVEWMLDDGMRGILIEPKLESAISSITYALEQKDLHFLAQRAQTWSEQYTFDRLNEEIKSVLLEV